MRRPHQERLAMDAATNKGAWSKQEDDKLAAHIQQYGEGCWRTLPQAAGLMRCGKSCRLRWVNYLKPGLKRGNFSDDEEDLIIKLHALLGNRWSLIAGRLPGRTDNEVKNYWNTHLRKKLVKMGVDPNNHRLNVTLHRPIARELSSKTKVIANAGDCLHRKPSKSSHHDEASRTEQVSDSGSCLLEDCNSGSIGSKLPDLNLDLALTSSNPPSFLEATSSIVKVEHQQGCNADESSLMRELIHEQSSTSPTLLLFT